MSVGAPLVTFAGKRHHIARAVALSVLASGSGIALMGVSGWLLSRAAEHPPVLYLMVAIVSVRFFGLSRGVLRYLERLLGHDVALQMQADLREHTYAQLTRRSWLGRGRGDLLSRMINDVEAVQDFVVRVVIPFTAAGLVIVATTSVLAVISPAAGLLILLSALVAGGLLPWLTARGSRRCDVSVAPLRAELATLVTGVAVAAVDLAAYDVGAEMGRRLAGIDDQLRRAEERAALVRGLTSAGQVVAAGFAVGSGLVVGGLAVADGRLAPVYLAVLVLTPVALHEVLAGLPGAAQIWSRTRSALLRVAEVLQTPPMGSADVATASHEGPPELALTEASVGWVASVPVLEGVNLSITAGQRVCLMGPNGAGKTTIAATVMGLVPLRSGEMTVRGRVGYLAQDAYIFDTTVAENVRIGKRDATDAEVRGVLARVRLDLDLDRLVGEHGTSLSGGEARRLALARLLLQDHPIMILDEPTEHLDRETARALTDDLWEATRDSATLVITHDPDLAARCDRTIQVTKRSLSPPTLPEPVERRASPSRRP